MSYPDLERGTGRTQFMIDQLCDAVAEGQPQSLVIVHDNAFGRYVTSRILDSLAKRGMASSYSYARGEIRALAENDRLCDASVIRVIPSTNRRAFEGMSGWGKFFDHEAENRFPAECNWIDAVVR